MDSFWSGRVGWHACWKPSAACLAASVTCIWIERVEAVVGSSLVLAYWALPQIGIIGMVTPHLPHSL